MTAGPGPSGDGVAAEERFAELGRALADAVEAALPGWVQRMVSRVMVASTGTVPPAAHAAATEAGRAAATEVGLALRALLAEDVDDQVTTPLAVIRDAVRYPTRVLVGAGVPAVARDRFVAETFPEDLYDLSPATFADVDPELTDLGLTWGAAKAFLHRRRHRSG